MDGSSRTSNHTLATDAALVVINVADIVLNGDSLELTFFLALTTTDTSSLTSLHGHRTLVLVDTRDEHSPTLRTLLAEFDDVARTSLDTSSASHTLLLVNLGKSGLGIHVDSIELTSSNTIATTQTAKSTSRLTSATGIHGSTRTKTAVLGNLRTLLACSVTTHNGNHRFAVGNGHS